MKNCYYVDVAVYDYDDDVYIYIILVFVCQKESFSAVMVTAREPFLLISTIISLALKID